MPPPPGAGATSTAPPPAADDGDDDDDLSVSISDVHAALLYLRGQLYNRHQLAAGMLPMICKQQVQEGNPCCLSGSLSGARVACKHVAGCSQRMLQEPQPMLALPRTEQLMAACAS